jgi:aarF domain-containing kinase
VILSSFQSFMSFVILFYQNNYSTFTDFTKEAKNSERTTSCFRKNSVVKVPYVFGV